MQKNEVLNLPVVQSKKREIEESKSDDDDEWVTEEEHSSSDFEKDIELEDISELNHEVEEDNSNVNDRESETEERVRTYSSSEDDTYDDTLNSQTSRKDKEKREAYAVLKFQSNLARKPKVSMKDCTMRHYIGHLTNVENMLTNRPVVKLESFDETYEKKPDKNEPVFKNVNPKWGWKEELLLLECVEACGLFNWKRIANLLYLNGHSGDKFEEQEVQDHFFQYYVNGTLGRIWNYRLLQKQVPLIDHTEGDPVDERAASKYLPIVEACDLKSIKFLPHREEFEVYTRCKAERMVTKLDFSSFFLGTYEKYKMQEEMKNVQLAIVDSYRREVAERIEMRKLMKDYKLMEQYFHQKSDGLRFKSKKAVCKLERDFQEMQKCIRLFKSPTDFLNFYYNSMKEELLKLEIDRLLRLIRARRKKENSNIPRVPEMKSLLQRRVPDCYSLLTKVLYCTGLEGEEESSSSQERKGLDDIKWTNVQQVWLEGIQQGKLQIEAVLKDRNSYEDIDLLKSEVKFTPNERVNIFKFLERNNISPKNISDIEKY